MHVRRRRASAATIARVARCSVVMEHRGVPYQVVQTASPNGFKWTVQLDATRIKSGLCLSKGNAIFTAMRVIDAALGADDPKIIPE